MTINCIQAFDLKAHIKAECTLALMPEFTKTACKRWLVERLDPPSIAEVLTLRADLPAETSKSAHSWPNLPHMYCNHKEHGSSSLPSSSPLRGKERQRGPCLTPSQGSDQVVAGGHYRIADPPPPVERPMRGRGQKVQALRCSRSW